LPDPVIASPSKPAAHKSTLPNNSNDVLKRVHGWASAWSGKNVKSYLAYYAEDFKIPGGGSRAGWEAQRNERINKPKSIQVGIISPKVKFIDDSHASVSFKQSYRTSQLKTSTAKTLILEKSGDKWLIQDERTGK
jgi:ketosteroid isomerase-like protein